MTRMTTCPTCGTYGYIPPPEEVTTWPHDPNRRKVRAGETFDLAPYEVVDLVTSDGSMVVWTFSGGPGGMKGMKVG